MKTCPDGEVFDPANSHCVPYEQASCRGDYSLMTLFPLSIIQLLLKMLLGQLQEKQQQYQQQRRL